MFCYYKRYLEILIQFLLFAIDIEFVLFIANYCSINAKLAIKVLTIALKYLIGRTLI